MLGRLEECRAWLRGAEGVLNPAPTAQALVLPARAAASTQLHLFAFQPRVGSESVEGGTKG